MSVDTKPNTKFPWTLAILGFCTGLVFIAIVDVAISVNNFNTKYITACSDLGGVTINDGKTLICLKLDSLLYPKISESDSQ